MGGRVSIFVACVVRCGAERVYHVASIADPPPPPTRLQELIFSAEVLQLLEPVEPDLTERHVRRVLAADDEPNAPPVVTDVSVRHVLAPVDPGLYLSLMPSADVGAGSSLGGDGRGDGKSPRGAAGPNPSRAGQLAAGHCGTTADQDPLHP